MIAVVRELLPPLLHISVTPVYYLNRLFVKAPRIVFGSGQATLSCVATCAAGCADSVTATQVTEHASP